MVFSFNGAAAVSSDRSLDILVISRCPAWPLHEGDRLILYNLARAFEAQHFNLELLAFYQRPSDLADVPFYDRYFRKVTLVREPLRNPSKYMWRWMFGPRYPRKAKDCWSSEMWQHIVERLKSQIYDVVHLFGGIQVYEFAGLLANQPTVITPYESYSLYLEREYAQSADDSSLRRLMAWLRLRMAKNFESWMFDRFDQVVVVSKNDANVFRELNPNLRMTVIPNGVDIVRFTPSGEPAHKPILIFTGNFAYKPNYDAALLLAEKIFPAVRKRVPKAHLMLVGVDPPPRLLKVGESEHITVTGRVPDVRVYLDRAAAFVCPMRLGAGIKNKVLEAMAMGVPVVATPMSCDGIDVTDGEDVLLAEKPSEMVKQTIRLIKSRSLRERIGAAGRALVEERYTWGCVAAQYEALYRRVREAKLR